MRSDNKIEIGQFNYMPVNNYATPSHLTPNPDMALVVARDIAKKVTDALVVSNLIPPDASVITSGGFWRDMAVGNTPKDFDLFVFDEHIPTVEKQIEAAHVAARALGLEPLGYHQLKVYGNWSPDIWRIVKIDTPDHQPDFDLVVVMSSVARKWAEDNGLALPAYTRTPWPILLDWAFHRFDIRLNAIGADAYKTYLHPKWKNDVRDKRLVVQYDRIDWGHHDGPQIDTRITARLNKFMHRKDGKFKDWTMGLERIDGVDRNGGRVDG